jgi:hypothetical protein
VDRLDTLESLSTLINQDQRLVDTGMSAKLCPWSWTLADRIVVSGSNRLITTRLRRNGAKASSGEGVGLKEDWMAQVSVMHVQHISCGGHCVLWIPKILSLICGV